MCLEIWIQQNKFFFLPFSQGYTSEQARNLSMAFRILYIPSLLFQIKIVAICIRSVKNCRESVKNTPSSNAHYRVMNEPLNVNILECVQDGSNVSVPEFSSDLRVSTRTTYYAFYDELHFRNLCAKWVPHFLTQDQRKEGANFFPHIAE